LGVFFFFLFWGGFSLAFAWPCSSSRCPVMGFFMLTRDWQALLRLTREKRGSAFDFRPESFLVTIAYSTLNLVFESGVMSNDGAQLLRRLCSFVQASSTPFKRSTEFVP